jgi:hypothetical protein
VSAEGRLFEKSLDVNDLKRHITNEMVAFPFAMLVATFADMECCISLCLQADKPVSASSVT